MVEIDLVFCVQAEYDLVFVLGVSFDLVIVWVVEIGLIFVSGPKVTWFLWGDRNGLGFCVDARK